MTRSVVAGLRGLATGSVAGAERVLNEDRIRLAVTGLSRAGKTVFITSLIHNLLALGKGRDTLPRLTGRLTQNGATRLRSVEVLPAGAGVLPFFDYASKLDQLASARSHSHHAHQISENPDLKQIDDVVEMLGSLRKALTTTCCARPHPCPPCGNFADDDAFAFKVSEQIFGVGDFWNSPRLCPT